MRRWVLFAAARVYLQRVLGALLLAVLPMTAQAQELFGTSETYSAKLSIFPKWVGVVGKHGGDAGAICKTGGCSKKEWNSFITSQQGKSRSAQIEQVNRFHNRHPYIEDINNWGVRDYWETVPEFLTKYGDCEDYAISKFISLKRLGVPAASMRIVVLKDTNLGVMHSVLAVYEGGDILILDNQIDQVVSHRTIRHYTPVYSINESGWWRHR